jgi:hypothetical protein
MGIIMLAFSNFNFEGGFVFVFPFFFFGNVDSLGIVTIIAILLFMTVFFILIVYNWFSFKQPVSHDMKTYVKYDAFCPICGEALPRNARYCPSCGHEQGKSSGLENYRK